MNKQTINKQKSNGFQRKTDQPGLDTFESMATTANPTTQTTATYCCHTHPIQHF